jgi:release factor glutamine methyltransferase
MQQSITIQQCLQQAAQQLKMSQSPRLDAEVMLAHILNVPRSYLYAHFSDVLSAEVQTQFEVLLSRRLSGEPIAYLLGHKEFWSMELIVTPDTLIPRPETEVLVELALAKLPAGQVQRVADLGTGSGAIALAIAKSRPHWEILAVDESPAALAVAEQNAKNHQITNITFHRGHWCKALPLEPVHAIISNPPYLKEDDPHLRDDGVKYEPKCALVAGKDGLAALTEIINHAYDHIWFGGFIMLEHGAGQRAAVVALMENAGYTGLQYYSDSAGIERVVIGMKQ